jgi:hypothetical protein
MVEADPALVASRPEALRASALPGNDPGYALGIAFPRTMNRLATLLATAVLLALLPVSIWAYATRHNAASDHIGQASGPTTVEAGRAPEVLK